jgi:thiosulfate/3-mercaptopyruvate sulfurtransferase
MLLCTPNWLKEHLNEEHIVILDSSWHMPNTQRNAEAEFLEAHIPVRSYL